MEKLVGGLCRWPDCLVLADDNGYGDAGNRSRPTSDVQHRVPWADFDCFQNEAVCVLVGMDTFAFTPNASMDCMNHVNKATPS